LIKNKVEAIEVLARPQTRNWTDRCTGPNVEIQEKAVNMSRRKGADQLFWPSSGHVGGRKPPRTQ